MWTRCVGKMVRFAVVVGVLAVGLGFVGVSGAAGQTVADIEVRDRLVADQEALLNVYRCMFGVDVEVVPGGCANGAPAQPAKGPAPFAGVPTAGDLAVRDQLVADQEALLNVYRCQFNIDTGLVPDGCQSDADTQPTPEPTPTTPENLGPVAPSGEAWVEDLSISKFMADCGYWEGIHGQCRNHPEDTDEVIRRKSEMYGCEWSRQWHGCRGYGGGRMRQLEDRLFCQGGWTFRSWIPNGNAPGYCFHPDHPTYGIDSR